MKRFELGLALTFLMLVAMPRAEASSIDLTLHAGVPPIGVFKSATSGTLTADAVHADGSVAEAMGAVSPGSTYAGYQTLLTAGIYLEGLADASVRTFMEFTPVFSGAPGMSCSPGGPLVCHELKLILHAFGELSSDAVVSNSQIHFAVVPNVSSTVIWDPSMGTNEDRYVSVAVRSGQAVQLILGVGGSINSGILNALHTYSGGVQYVDGLTLFTAGGDIIPRTPIQAVPEPATLLLLGTGVLWACAKRRQ